MTRRLGLTFGCIAAVVAALVACSDGGGDSGGRRGETCESTADCADNLSCLGGECQVGSFGLAITTRECVLIECAEAVDCCAAFEPEQCPEWREQCAGGDSVACTQVDVSCCSEEDFECRNDRCITRCTTDTDCGIGNVCSDGTCVECATDDDCPLGTCVDNVCAEECEEDFDCPVFFACQEATCVEVGCSSDRECIAQFENVLATCHEGECEVPCTADFECASAAAFSFNACRGGQCVDIGCSTDEECRIRLNVAAGSFQDAACREPE